LGCWWERRGPAITKESERGKLERKQHIPYIIEINRAKIDFEIKCRILKLVVDIEGITNTEESIQPPRT
jgi:hypothetical protein